MPTDVISAHTFKKLCRFQCVDTADFISCLGRTGDICATGGPGPEGPCVQAHGGGARGPIEVDDESL